MNENNSTNFTNHSGDNIHYANSEIFNETPLNDLKKRLIVTQQIDSAMEILDHLRVNNQKLSNSKKIHFNSKVNFSEMGTSETKLKKNFLAPLGPIKPRKSSISSNLLVNNKEDRLKDTNVDKIDPIVRYSEWKSVWLKSLENI